jgi:CheY-like chemotaxis protein
VERILVIYDDPGFERIARRILESAGYDVITAPCYGPVAMDVFHNTNPGLVVLDVCLPRKSDQDLCRQIRGNSVLDRFLPELSKKQELVQQILQEASIRRFDPGPCSKSSIAPACAGAFFCYGFMGSSVVLRIRSLFFQVVDCRRRSFLRHPALPTHTRDISSLQSGQGPIAH